MDRFECIQYLIDRACTGSEWQEAGMFLAIQEVMSPASEDKFGPLGLGRDEKVAWLEDLLGQARNY